MKRFTKQVAIIDAAMTEIRMNLIEDIKRVLLRVSKYRKYQGKRIAFVSGMGAFFLSVDGETDANHFGLMDRLNEVVDHLGDWTNPGRGQFDSPLSFFRCDAIPDGDIHLIGGITKFHGELT